MGVIYRSPSSAEENNEALVEMMKKATAAKFDQLMICGDFNLPLIDWDHGRCLDGVSSFTATFCDALEELDLH